MSNNATWDVVVVGGANTDYTIRGEELPKPGETIRGAEFQIGQGGKGANQAVAAARLGARVTFVGRLGHDDRGEAMLAQLRQEHVETASVIRDANTPTGTAVVQVGKGGEKQILAVPYANGKVTTADLRDCEAIRDTHVLILQLEISIEAVVEAAKLAHAAGAQVLLDPSPPGEVPDELLRHLTLIKPNSSEAEALTGVKVTDRDSAREAAHQLRQRGVKAISIQAGREGNLLVWPEGEVWLPKLPVESVDATGAGDALMAALGVALAEGRTWEEAGHFATAAAALTTTKVGAQTALPFRQELDEFITRRSKQEDD